MRGLHLPGHYMPHPGMTDEELLQIAGSTDMTQVRARARLLGTGDPMAALQESLARPLPSLGEGYVPDLPLRPGDQQELDSHLPLPDFVPETVTDPHVRARMRKRIREREEEQHSVFNREGQWGGQAPGLVPAGTVTSFTATGPNDPRLLQPSATSKALLLNWSAPSEAPMAVNVQLSYTLDNPGAAGAATDDVSLYAKIEWGSGRANHMAICDFQNGSQVRLTASWVRVSALYQPIDLPSGWPKQPVQLFGTAPSATTGPSITASAILGKGFPTFTTAAARFTRKVNLLFANPLPQLSLDPIPPFASAFGFGTSLTADLTGANVINFLVDVNASGGEGAGGVARFNTQKNFAADNTFPIPNGGRFLSVNNNTNINFTMQIVYALML